MDTTGRTGSGDAGGDAQDPRDRHDDGKVEQQMEGEGSQPTQPASDAPGALPGATPEATPLNASDASEAPASLERPQPPVGAAAWLPVGAGAGSGAARALRSGDHASTRSTHLRRRRRYLLYLNRTGRARRSARSLTFARAAWATAIALIVIVAAVTTASVGAAASYYTSQQGLVDSLNRTVSSKDSVRIFDAHGTLLYEFRNDGIQHSIPLAKIPVNVVNATISIEDRTFWTNPGIDLTSIIRAAQADLSHGSIAQGGSTITQQLVKQDALKDSSDTASRKLSEAILSVGMTTQGVYTKQQILAMYLNSIDYGYESYGIDAAAQTYFGYQDDTTTGETAAQHLDLAQASMLAGVPQNPNLNNPLEYFSTARVRQAEVLKGMVSGGYITQAQSNAAWAEAGKAGFIQLHTDQSNLAPQFVEFVKEQLSSMVDTGQLHLSRSGLNVYTTLDLDLQNHTQAAMKQHLLGIDGTDYAGGGLIRNNNVTNSAAILVDHHNGDIKVYLGSMDATNPAQGGPFDVVKDGYRGPGSAFKPFVYATAFEKGWFPAMSIADMPTVFWDAGSQTAYKPLDFTNYEFWGNVTLRTALQNSLNIPAVKVMQFVGPDTVKANVARMGMTKTVGTWGLSSVLGAIQVTPYEMAQAYTVFANYGQYIPLHAINSITDSSGDVLFQYHVPQGIQVMSPQIAFLITSILSDNRTRAKDFNVCNPLYLDPQIDPNAIPGKWISPPYTKGCGALYAGHGYSPAAWPDAAKTGTGSDFKDDWTVGYTMDYTAAVWVGNNNDTPMTNIDGVTGAAPIWYHSMLYAERNLPKTPFPVPAGVHQASYTSGGLTTTDWFLDGPPPAANVGESSTQILPCIKLNNNGANPWDYSNGPCQGLLKPNGGPGI